MNAYTINVEPVRPMRLLDPRAWSLVVDWSNPYSALPAFVLLVAVVLTFVGLALPARAGPWRHSVRVRASMRRVWQVLHAVDHPRLYVTAGALGVVDLERPKPKPKDDADDDDFDDDYDEWAWTWRELRGGRRATDSCVRWRQARAIAPIELVRHGADSDTYDTRLLEVTLSPAPRPNGQPPETIVEFTETVTIRTGSWHTPLLRIIARLWPAYTSKDYARRIQLFSAEFPAEGDDESLKPPRNLLLEEELRKAAMAESAKSAESAESAKGGEAKKDR